MLVVLLLVALVVYPLSLGIVAWQNVNRVEALESGVDTPGTTFLLVGSDSRAGLSDEQIGTLATGTEADAGGRRTDTILLLHVPTGTGPAVLVSLPRDSYLELPGRGMNKINAAYAFGGPQLLTETVEQATGMGVDSYVETGFAGFATIVDALAGVEVCLPEPLTDPMANIDLPAGCQVLGGPDALGFVRSRQADARGDLARVERQRQLLSGIVSATLSPGLLLDPPRAYATAAAGGGALTVDEGTSPLDLGRFLLGMRSVSGPEGISLTVPVSDPDLRTEVGSAVQWDEATAERLFASLRSDDTAAVRELVTELTPPS